MSEIVTSDLTPNRKRKRDHEKSAEVVKNAFSNAAFASTPKKIVGRRRLIPAVKENINPLNTCMEVKSIAELVEQQKNKATSPLAFPHNPYEVQRKPPKKKKREASIEEACFENPALNLNVPEKQFNPYEVIRDVNKSHEDQRKCFVNAALDIKGQDAMVAVRNPFEIDRENVKNTSYDNANVAAGYENFALQPTSLKIGIPFKPTVGCRIDFNNIPLTQLTPSKLLLSEKLVFSPVAANSTLPKRSLDAISEESSSVSIGKELDRYQLELENSINEAKIQKQDAGVAEKECVYQLQLKVDKRVSLSTKLSDIVETEEYEVESTQEVEIKEIKTENVDVDLKKQNQVKVEIQRNEELEKLEEALIEEGNKPREGTLKSKTDVKNYDNRNAGFTFDSDEEDNIDFKAPAPFVRAYRRDNVPKSTSKESLNSNSSAKSSSENIATSKKENIVKNLIRKSIRKILPNNHHHVEVDSDIKLVPEELQAKDQHDEKHCTLKSHIMSSLRHSLRRKPKQKDNSEKLDSATAEINPLADISIIDTSERKMKLKSSLPQNEYARIEELTNEKKHSLRHGSLRHSTREMRQQIMKTIFQHKQEEYTFQK